jgi:sphinganine-1-phosphate aldolase
MKPLFTIPEKGLAKEDLFQIMRQTQEADANWKEGRTWSLVYYGGKNIDEVIQEAYQMFFHCNGLNPIAFKSLNKFETEVVAMAASLLGGGDDTAGSMTSGGSESIFMAVKTARDYARFKKPEISSPEMILPVSVHPAFEKAAHFLNIKPRRIPLGGDFRADVAAVKEAITENTILLVGSAPAYPHGVIDPITDLADLAWENQIWFHVDACLGGFLLPFLKELGHPIPPFDFQVEGVSSISADLHKYGFAAKGASVILYRDRELRRHQFFVYPDWPGGLFASSTATGTRPGGSIAAAWAIMNYLGKEGYLELARKIMDITKALQKGIASIPELYILGNPEMSVFAFAAEELDVYALADAMDARGWHLDRQQKPPCLHLMVTPAHAGIVDVFLKDLRDSVEDVKGKKGQNPEGTAAMYGMMGTLPDRKAVGDFLLDYIDSLTSSKLEP